MTDNKIKPLAVSQCEEATFKRNIFCAIVPHGTTKQDFLTPEFWGNFAQQLNARDQIEIYAEDGTYYAKLIVLFVPEKTPTKPANYAKVCMIEFHDLTEKASESEDTNAKDPSPALPDGFVAKWRGNQKWCVLRGSDGTVIVEKQASKEDALREFFKQKKMLAA